MPYGVKPDVNSYNQISHQTINISCVAGVTIANSKLCNISAHISTFKKISSMITIFLAPLRAT